MCQDCKPEGKRTPTDMLEVANVLAKDSIIFAANIHLYWDNPRSKEEVRQGIWNLRNGFKANGKMFIGMTTAGAIVPSELTQDALVLDEPLPTAAELGKIVKQVFTDAVPSIRNCVPIPMKRLSAVRWML